MFRRPRQTKSDRLSIRLSETLRPLTVIPWGALAPMIVVQDEDYTAAIERLEKAGFHRSVPNRAPPPEIMEDHPNPQQMLEEINAHYKRLDRSCAVFDYPDGDPAEKGLQPLEQTLVESFVKAAIDEETETGFSAWGESLRSWVSLMTGYLDDDNDVLDHCPDKQAVEWYSHNFGRIHEANFGPIDRRVSKRLGSGKEMPIDMRGNPIYSRQTVFNSGIRSN
ncbi:hypothetical protein BDV28DRAFT_158026 [Aspergillus coremiiformis]|uniref:Uncharacterized protein n=1 Tax=Aspergillus coremiiformis TaxID=138285 RepID=A0A5N6Z3M7_9EURO|nr:hypothetical protein BDV28DRAFT_158026 [Aspergillus coremiiformis]